MVPAFEFMDRGGAWHKLQVWAWRFRKALGYKKFGHLSQALAVAPDHRLLCFFVPKNACTTLRSMVASLNGLRMDEADEVAVRHVGAIYSMHPFMASHPSFKHYFKFSFVRNPWDRLVSCYENKIVYVRENDDEAASFSRGAFWVKYPNYDLKNMSFEEFVQMVIRQPDEEYFCDEHFKSQHCFFAGHKMDFIGRFENFQNDLNELVGKLGLPPHYGELAKKKYNQSKRSHYTDYYDDQTRRLVAQRYAKDLHLFGYKYGD